MNRLGKLLAMVTILASLTGVATYVVIELFVYGSIR